ncbi:MAG: manganese efflux pump MntP family protein [Spirochaetales bacterium]|jgi:putative Mn2+ efflux pump MntP|nr:manganese efflux pump MntP family protein [Spirochaetales bacterium]
MNTPEIFLIAVGLSMDAFAVAISLGLSVPRAGLREMAAAGLYFGSFQALMPLAGYFLGTSFADKITGLDHWIAFVLLGFIGGKMIKDSFGKDKQKGEKCESPFQCSKMLVLSVATSIDAFAVGVTFAFFNVKIFAAASFIGATTCVISMSGVKIGKIFGNTFKSKAEFAGGAILILLGIKILMEHLSLT